MSSYARLPHTLLDATLARATARLHVLSAKSLGKAPARYAQSAAALASTPDSRASMFPLPGSTASIDEFALYARRKKSKKSETGLQPRKPSAENKSLSELEEKVLALAEVAEADEPLLGTPAYSEDKLLMIYADLLATPKQYTEVEEQSQVEERDQAEVDAKVIQAVSERFLDEASHTNAVQSGQHHTPIISRLQEISATITSAVEIAGVASTSTSDATPRAISPGLLTRDEWFSLIRTCTREGDGGAAESVLQLMKALGDEVEENYINEVLALYAGIGEVEPFERLLRNMVPASRSDAQRDLHVKSYISSSPPGYIPVSAITLLHTYESSGRPAPQKSYTRVIATLARAKHESARAHALSLDLFAHMRYAAHPDPDPVTYAVMMQACCPPQGPSDALRALDLWTEMTIDRRMPPTQHTYTAVILACARSGEGKYIHEAFRLAKEMLDRHRDAYGAPAFHPTLRLFGGLLEGAKRLGDLRRVRWILAEMVRDSEGGALNEKTMTHVFHAYAAYKPPFRREMARVVGEVPPAAAESAESIPAHAKTASVPEGASISGDALVPEDATGTPPETSSSGATEDNHPEAQFGLLAEPFHPSFAHIPPQGKDEVVREARRLFSRILSDRHAQATSPTSPPPKFALVNLTPRLLNAYLAVHCAHAPFEVWASLWRTLYQEHGVARNGRSYIEILERCAIAPAEKRRLVRGLADEVWAEWKEVEERWREGRAGEDDPASLGNPRFIERATGAMVRILCNVRDTRRALEIVKEFEWHYPPGAVRLVKPKPQLFSTRTALFAARPLVRLSSTVDIADDRVPPILTFSDLELLHHRLIAAGDVAGIRYVTGLCKAYQGSLKIRRDTVIRALPQAQSSGPESDAREEKDAEEERADERGAYMSF